MAVDLDKIINEEFKIYDDIYKRFLEKETEHNRMLIQQCERFLKHLYCIKHNTNEADRVGYINFILELEKGQKND